MKLYDVSCPICGALNKNLYLEETHGCMECEKCQATVIVTAEKCTPTTKVPFVGIAIC